MFEIAYGDGHDVPAHELAEFYERLNHDIDAETQQIQVMMNNSVAFVSARCQGRLIGIARGVSDGVRGWLTECKLDPVYQGPAAVTKKDGRIEHDANGIAAEMGRRVIDKLMQTGARRIDVLAWGTEVDFLEELGFRRGGGLVAMTMKAEDALVALTNAAATTNG